MSVDKVLAAACLTSALLLSGCPDTPAAAGDDGASAGPAGATGVPPAATGPLVALVDGNPAAIDGGAARGAGLAAAAGAAGPVAPRRPAVAAPVADPVAPRSAPDRRAAPPPDPALLDGWPTASFEGLMNGGFELVADGTTTPPKYGACWRGAFAPEPDDPHDLVEAVPDAAEGARVLRLAAGDDEVAQKIVADGRFTGRLELRLAWRGAGGARLQVGLEDGPGDRLAVLLPEADGLDAVPDERGWRQARLDLGVRFADQEGHPPRPRLWLHLRAIGPEGGHVDVDAVHATVLLASPSARDLGAYVMGLVRWTLDLWFLPPARGGLGLVDPDTGWVLVNGYDVQTGEPTAPTRSVSFHTIHTLLIEWLRLAEARGWDDEVALWQPELRRIVTTLLARHFDPETGLPRTIDRATGKPDEDQPTTVGAYVEFLVDARPLLGDDDLAAACARQVRTIADTLLRLQAEHDLDPERFPNDAKVDLATGIFHGTWPNWFGHIPNRLTPRGEIDTPRRYNTAWAIVKQRDFWYHFFKSPAAIMAAHELDPKPGDLPGVRRSLTRYHRDWDASRYDLENDTDDHYGYLCEDLMTLLRHSAGQTPRALELVQEATDHRLPRDAGDAGDTLWVQAVRLGTACAGDSPRAIKGVLDLYQLPPEVNPLSAGLPLYRDAILELAANDFKGRQLTNGQFTESFFKTWEMVCICFKGTYQGDCREHPWDWWQGDVGDIFGGPPQQGLEAQGYALQVARTEAERDLVLARLATILQITETTLRRPWGYVFGLDPKVAEQYELPPKYTLGLDPRTTRGLAYVMSWAKVLPALQPGG